MDARAAGWTAAAALLSVPLFGARESLRLSASASAATVRLLDDALEGGVNASLNLDGHGKSLSSLLLGMELDLP